MYKLLELKTLKVTPLTEFKASQWMQDNLEKLVPNKQNYEEARTPTHVLYGPNLKSRARTRIKLTRLACVLAQQHNTDAIIESKTNRIRVGDTTYKLADQVHSQQELAHHQFYGKVISATKTTLAPVFKMDTSTIKDYYLNKFKLPSWFEKYCKFRHFRYCLLDGQFKFHTRTYSHSRKKPATNRMKQDIKHFAGNIAKAYFSLNSFLNPRKEKAGLGRQLRRFYLAFDIDSEDHNNCIITPQGYCKECHRTSTNKLERFLEALKTVPGLEPKNVLWSGSKGWHVHCAFKDNREVNEKDMLVLNHYFATQYPGLIDDFTYKNKRGNLHYDAHRIFKIPNSTDATTCMLVSSRLERLPVSDRIETIKQ